MVNLGFIGVLSAYVVVGVLLLSLNVAPRWSWWVKAVSIVVTSAFFIVSYYSIIDIMGWPVKDDMPEKFQLHWARITEPDKMLNTPGSIFLWVEELDDQNIPQGIPRAFRLPYTVPLDNGVNDALDMISNGQDVGGTAQEYDEEEQEQEDGEEEDADPFAELPEEDVEGQGYADADELKIDGMLLQFQELELVVLPNKGEE
jgi:hypothetical protein